MAVEKLILFRLNGQMYGINVEFVSAIESVTDIVRVPNAPSNIEGIINLRGEVIPVYSLHKKFDLAMNRAKTESQLIITKSENHVFAFMVDAVDEIHMIEEGEFLAPPDVLRSKDTTYIQGIAYVSDKLVLCLDVDELMSETELQRMQSFVDQMTKSE